MNTVFDNQRCTISQLFSPNINGAYDTELEKVELPANSANFIASDTLDNITSTRTSNGDFTDLFI